MIALDTTFLIDLLSGDPAAKTKALEIEGEHLVTTHLNVFEILVGLCRVRASEKRLSELNKLLDKLTILGMDKDSTVIAAMLFSKQMAKGERIEQNDCIVAAILKSNGCQSIVTRNERDYSRLGIQVHKY